MIHPLDIARRLMPAIVLVALWPSLGFAQVPRVEPLPEISPNHPGSCQRTLDGDNDGSLDEVTVHKYKGKKLVKSLVHSDPKKKPARLIEYEYDDKGRLMKMKSQLVGNHDTSTEKSGTETSSQRGFGSSQDRLDYTPSVSFRYNDAGKLESRTISSYGRGSPNWSESYEYDDGEVVAKLVFPSSCEDFSRDDRETYVRKDGKIRQGVSKCFVTTYKYDSSGRLTESHARSMSRRARPDVVTAYEYDSQGNLVKVVRKVVTKATWKGDSVTKQTVSTTTYDFSCWKEKESSATK